MNPRNADLDRLLRSAASAPEETAVPEAPFGFDTRVLSRARGEYGWAGDAAELGRFLRRVGLTAFAVLALASAAAYQQFSEGEERTAPQSNEYAIADSAIQTEISQ
ncbi:MAG: hypothetical protein M3N12_07415 [Verrucomicrobiota bacterium]|nr:hypothetical protein [Verrucomicrobiota bacterium]